MVTHDFPLATNGWVVNTYKINPVNLIKQPHVVAPHHSEANQTRP
jgi:hypothetical protein